MELFKYAFCPHFDERLRMLAGMCPEKWSFSQRTDNRILKNYIMHTFLKLFEEEKVFQKEDYSLFNTGLYTPNYEAIYAYFTKNQIEERQPWFLNGFFNAYQIAMMGITELPMRANYFSHPEELVFDTNCDIVPQYEHIFGDEENLNRIPELVRNSPNAIRLQLFDGAIKRAKNMIDANYKTAVPQYYKGKIQLLIPVYLTNEREPDLALVVSKNEKGNQYLGRTCLTLDMAYNNARLIARPDSAWLTV